MWEIYYNAGAFESPCAFMIRLHDNGDNGDHDDDDDDE
ncbi:predicted protein [Sclerotinia sclerotiorum 1980 UF-70]|uniref:Uncharacterized protein n=1 Tax=Sclerotinia sclerotiorum (strain ATCC 18683 / 1980 / Ss-1) TaxID=665079 RepID=A7ELV2_SCLS1|nr:predicted protein [Sclerotinia sclerotiorum 1980 UF-70]EDO03818.1 predicted protein [Sclerotinia sclerotiorum 1980 UF-70]